MKNNKKKLLSIIGILVLGIVFIGASYAFFEATTSDAVVRNVNILSHTVDTFSFSISNNLNLTTDFDNFQNGDGNVSGSTTATAILTPNSKTGAATEHYYLSFYISSNNTRYSAANTNHDPEYLLQLFNANNELVSISGLGAQKTVGTLTGYDITGYKGLIKILDNHTITASNHIATTETWQVVITAINHDFNQNDNTGKSIVGNLLLNKEGFDFCELNPDDCLSLAAVNMPETVGKTVTPTCSGATATWNNTYNQLEISSISTNRLDCSLTYSNATGTTPLNTYLLTLEGTTQGNGKFIHEIGAVPSYASTSVVTNFGTIEYFHNNDDDILTQTNVDSYWTFNSSTGVFTSDPSKFIETGTINYYHAYIEISESGYYQVCYSISQSSSTQNDLRFFKNDIYLTGKDSSSSDVEEGCIDFGYLNSSDYVNISQYGYSGTSSPVMTFWLKKSTSSTTSVDTGYRFEGKNPNNYVMFNNELWRIIGVFSTEYDSDNNGTTETTGNLVKIIRANSIGGHAWDIGSFEVINNEEHYYDSRNNWETASLNHLLNYQYYDWQTNRDDVGLYCTCSDCYYYYSNYYDEYFDVSYDPYCDYSVKGIKDGFRGMIANVKWYNSGPGNDQYYSLYPDNIYSYERDSSLVYSEEDYYTGETVTWPATTIGRIGLMYMSDYLYAVLKSDCGKDGVRSESANDYPGYHGDCSGKNWLYGAIDYIITPYSSYGNMVGVINNSGIILGEYSPYQYFDVRPTLYLSPSVYKISGTGTITDPYIIGM